MITAMERVTQAYQMSALWYALDNMPKKQSGSKSPSASRSELPHEASEKPYPFDRFAERTAHGIARILSAAANLKQTTDSLLSGRSAFRKRTASSDRPRVAEVAVTEGARLQDYSIRTYQTAGAQRNSGFAFTRTDIFPLAGGYGEFVLTQTGNRKPVAVAFEATDTCFHALNKVRRALNRLEAGVTARLVPGGSPGTVKLELTADETGSTHAFSLNDIRGDIVAVTGIGSPTVPATNAVFRVDGGSVVSSSVNRIVLDEGRVTVSLKQASPDPVLLSVRPDVEAVQADIARLVGQYNELRIALDEANGWLNPFIRIMLLSGLPFRKLAIAGIQLHSDGMLQLREHELVERLTDQFEAVERSLSGDEGFAEVFGRAADRLQSMPADGLLNRWYNGFQTMTRYSAAGRYGYNYGPGNPALRSYWPMPIAGYLLNDYL